MGIIHNILILINISILLDMIQHNILFHPKLNNDLLHNFHNINYHQYVILDYYIYIMSFIHLIKVLHHTLIHIINLIFHELNHPHISFLLHNKQIIQVIHYINLVQIIIILNIFYHIHNYYFQQILLDIYQYKFIHIILSQLLNSYQHKHYI